MTLYLLRHGNTFATGETPVIVGRGQDLPLTQEGEAQASRAAAYLQGSDLQPARVYCGNLKRTRRTAEIICDALQLPPPVIDERLTEIDYGDWSGLAGEEVQTRFGVAEWEAWEREAIMPAERHWSPDAATIEANVASFAADVKGTPALAVTSNGLLRFFARLDSAAYNRLKIAKKLKVATGRLCRFDSVPTGYKLKYWNRSA